MNFTSPDRAFVTIGNNDGPHDMAFVDGGDQKGTEVYSEQVLSRGLIQPVRGRTYNFNGASLDPIDFYKRTGCVLCSPTLVPGSFPESLTPSFLPNVSTRHLFSRQTSTGIISSNFPWISVRIHRHVLRSC